MGKGGVKYESPKPTEQETELMNILVAEAKKRESWGPQRDAILKEILGTDFGDISKKDMARLDDIVGTYKSTRNEGITESADLADKALRTKWANQGILDSSIAADADVNLAKEVTKARDTVAKDAEMFRYGTEADLKKSYLNEKLTKIGLLQNASDPSLAASMAGTLSSQRSAEANQALQIALSNAQNSGGWGGILGSTLGMGLGAILAAPTGGLSLLGGAALGGALGGGGGSMLERGFR